MQMLVVFGSYKNDQDGAVSISWRTLEGKETVLGWGCDRGGGVFYTLYTPSSNREFNTYIVPEFLCCRMIESPPTPFTMRNGSPPLSVFLRPVCYSSSPTVQSLAAAGKGRAAPTNSYDSTETVSLPKLGSAKATWPILLSDNLCINRTICSFFTDSERSLSPSQGLRNVATDDSCWYVESCWINHSKLWFTKSSHQRRHFGIVVTI